MSEHAQLTGKDLADLIALVGMEEQRSPTTSEKMKALRKKLIRLRRGAPVGIGPIVLESGVKRVAVDLTEASEMLGVCRKGLRKEIEDGALPAFLAAGSREWRIRITELEKYMERLERRAGGAKAPVMLTARENGRFASDQPLLKTMGN